MGAGATAAPLNPGAFGSLGTLDLVAGDYTINTTGPAPTLRDAGDNVLFTGSLYSQGVPDDTTFHGYNPQIAVFSFDAITLGAGVNITAFGENPLALLSRSTATLGGTIDASAENGSNGIGSLGGTGDGLGGRGGPGGGKGGDGGEGPAQSSKGENGHGPGGGYGWTGGNGTRGNGGGFGGRGGGGLGGLVDGSSYGDLTQFLQGGSGAGGTGTDLFLTKGAGGGGGGGGIEITALDAITFLATSEVLANGGNGGGGGTALAGGGSGGGIILAAPTITGGGIVSANGRGFDGGGGRILFLTNDGGPVDGFSGLTVARGTSYGEEGVITYAQLPEPATLALLLAGGSLLLTRTRRAG